MPTGSRTDDPSPTEHKRSDVKPIESPDHILRLDARTASDDHISTLCEIVASTGFVCLPDQHLDAAELTTFVARLGPLTFTPGETPLDRHEFVFEVTNRNRTDIPRSVWHTDTSYVDEPPAYSVLCAVDIPERGGQTVFVSQTRAAATLHTELASDLAGVDFLHVASRVPDADAAGTGAWHPVLRRHPLTGETSMFVTARERLSSARRAGRILSSIEADDLIDRTVAHATSPARTRHEWASGDVVVLDNRSTLHCADHSQVRGIRTLHRVMALPERPTPLST